MKKFVFILILILILLISFKVVNLMGPVDSDSDESIQLMIESGTSARQIARKLYNNNLIQSELLFNIMISVHGLENSLKAGIYDIESSKSMIEIINLLDEGHVATFRITIPEGFTVEDIARRLSVLTDYPEEDFLYYAGQTMGRNYLNLSGRDIKYALEGYLYPDTYIIPQEYGPEDILEVMLSVFEKRWLDRLDRISEADNDEIDVYEADYNDRQENSQEVVSQFTPHQIMTIASMIEKEARYDEEKPLVAAVIYNRLQRTMLLQIDACIQYILPGRSDRVLYSDLEIDSPYNTYLYPGLPPGPIASPGASSIEAALKPADVDYLFYFAREDGSHVFSRTYREHLELQKEMRNN
ncbi:MAG: endolytic transglycosylase MltG [Halanaerobiales bacterium]